ncbi:hypothetical protein C0583_01480 [Candidatus Parcubacteria bacterium]|nr:MAG: hypothetical protein C0583_01480 [Candidatus Parcubacteria bacterium]
MNCFFHPLAIELDSNTLESIQFAYISSKYVHRGIFRDDGARYFDHPKVVAWLCRSIGNKDNRSNISVQITKTIKPLFKKE